LNGLVTIDLNVTVVNTAPFPKFLVLNPAYGPKVYRDGGNGTTSVGMVNYNSGVWLMPYETVVINFNITKTESYQIPQVPCAGEDGNYLACCVVIPQLVNSPTQLSARSMFPLLDGHIRILSYEGIVRFTVSSPDRLAKYFAITIPIVFVDGKMYGIEPNYTMTYEEYKRSLYEYSGAVQKSGRKEHPTVPSLETNMFKLSDTLLTGVKVSPPPMQVPELEGYDNLPVWFVFTSEGVEIEYRVEWRGGR
jgi:hypothetical protein